MSLRIAQPPQESLDALDAAKARFELARAQPVRTLHAAGAHDVPLQHRVFNVSLSSLAAGGGLADATFCGWLYLVRAVPRVLMAEVAYDGAGQAHRFAALTDGPLAEGVLAKLPELERHPQVLAKSYEVTVLRVPALSVFAVWLKDDHGDEDLIAPIAPVPGFLAGQPTYSATAFEQALRHPAQERLRFDDRPR